jgi:hypothetical protein
MNLADGGATKVWRTSGWLTYRRRPLLEGGSVRAAHEAFRCNTVNCVTVFFLLPKARANTTRRSSYPQHAGSSPGQIHHGTVAPSSRRTYNTSTHNTRTQLHVADLGVADSARWVVKLRPRRCLRTPTAWPNRDIGVANSCICVANSGRCVAE